MLTYLTLFLGLVVGSHPVEVVGAAGAVRVEMWLDGELAARIPRQPWRAEIDFGEGLEPHRLTAVAYDAAGDEVDRVEQWLNLPRSRAEASLVLESPSEVGLMWESLENRRPRSTVVRLDGRVLPTDDGLRYRLPPMDPGSIHFLRAELEFEGNVRSSVEAVLGGRFGDEATVEMTAVALARERGRELPSAAELGGRIAVSGSPLPVVAVEEAPWELLAVLAPDAELGLGGLGRLIDRAGRGSSIGSGSPAGWEVRFLSPQPSQTATRQLPVDLFPISRPFTADDGELPYLLSHVQLGRRRVESRLAEAVAVAGVQAAAGNRPRAVLLVLGAGAGETGRFDVAQVRAYLSALQVPLVVWSTGPALSRTISPDRRPLSVATAWGVARDISSVDRLQSAVRELARQLEGQVIAWVEGAHLPQSVGLVEAPAGLGIAGR